MIATRLLPDPLTGHVTVEAYAVLRDRTLVSVSRILPYIDLQHNAEKNTAAAKTRVVQTLQEILDANPGY